jgi:aspartyl protease family protein
MYRLAVAGIVGAVSASLAAQAVIAYSRAHDGSDLRSSQSLASSQAPTADVASADTVDGTAAQIEKAADGHYWAEANVDGHDVRFLIDTGASAVSLTTDDARRLGIDTASLDYDAKVITAAGPTRAAHVKLESVSIAGAQVRDVDALVIENGLQTSLLGMTYLGRLSQFEATKSAMILRP